jgi:predicted small lipoprotein YifL
MRRLLMACVAVLAAALAGCSKDPGPVEVTPEMEAALKQEEQTAREGESTRQKTERRTGKLTAEEQERARQQHGRR